MTIDLNPLEIFTLIEGVQGTISNLEQYGTPNPKYDAIISRLKKIGSQGEVKQSGPSLTYDRPTKTVVLQFPDGNKYPTTEEMSVNDFILFTHRCVAFIKSTCGEDSTIGAVGDVLFVRGLPAEVKNA